MKPIHPPIVQSTVYSYENNDEMRDTMLSGEPFFYIRSGNPTVQAAADELAALEGGEAALLFASGMAAISCSLLALLRNGDHIVAHKEVFSQTRALMDNVLSKFGVTAGFVDANDIGSLKDAFRMNTKLVYVETPSNPALDIVDLASVADVARASGLLLLVDSTIATPVLQRPLDAGASLVLHSATKYLAGHSDVLCGAVVGNKDLIARIHAVQKLTGGILDPHAAFLLSRGLKTLALRMNQVCAGALRIAEFLSGRPEVQNVTYPFLPSHAHTLAARAQMRGGGGLISFELRDGLPAARKFVDALRVIRLATSLGGTESTIEIPYDLKKTRDLQEEKMGLIRLSVGIEDADLLRRDIESALQSCASGQAGSPPA